MQWFLTQATTFAFFYPLVMTYIWMTGAIIYYLRFERRQPTYNQPPDLPEYPFVSVLVPCYNEENNIEATLKALTDMHYPNYEIIAIDDGSSDASPQILNKLKDHISRLRVVHLTKNQGKAIALKSGALAARGDFLVCIDGDAILDHYAITWIMKPKSSDAYNVIRPHSGRRVFSYYRTPEKGSTRLWPSFHHLWSHLRFSPGRPAPGWLLERIHLNRRY